VGEASAYGAAIDALRGDRFASAALAALEPDLVGRAIGSLATQEHDLRRTAVGAERRITSVHGEVAVNGRVFAPAGQFGCARV
jgi:hypothetical protein